MDDASNGFEKPSVAIGPTVVAYDEAPLNAIVAYGAWLLALLTGLGESRGCQVTAWTPILPVEWRLDCGPCLANRACGPADERSFGGSSCLASARKT